MQILLIEDTIPLAQTITRYLGYEDITCTLRTDGQSGYQEALDRAYDVIILDISLPLMDGITLCQRLREAHRDTPILMLTSRNTREDIILGLDAGADDYLAKPCDYQELLARVRALSRRGMSEKSTSQIQFGGLSIDDTQKIVQYQWQEIPLSKREYELLLYFVHHSDRVIARQELAEKVWGIYDLFADQKVVDVYIGYLRKKITPELIETRKGFGYIITLLPH